MNWYCLIEELENLSKEKKEEGLYHYLAGLVVGSLDTNLVSSINLHVVERPDSKSNPHTFTSRGGKLFSIDRRVQSRGAFEGIIGLVGLQDRRVDGFLMGLRRRRL